MTVVQWRIFGFVTLLLLVFLLLSCIPSRAATKEKPKFDISPPNVAHVYFESAKKCTPAMPEERIGDKVDYEPVKVTEEQKDCSEIPYGQSYAGWIRCRKVTFEFLKPPQLVVTCPVVYFEVFSASAK